MALLFCTALVGRFLDFLRLFQTMESRPAIPDRKLLARLVLIREEARNMMGGGLLDERNDRGLSTLPEAEVYCQHYLFLIPMRLFSLSSFLYVKRYAFGLFTAMYDLQGNQLTITFWHSCPSFPFPICTCLLSYNVLES